MTLEIGTNLAYLAALPLVSLRCLGTFAVAPLFGSRFVPAQVRVVLGLLCGVLLVPLALGGAGGEAAAGAAGPLATLAAGGSWGALASPMEYAIRCAAEVLLGLGVGYLALLFLAAAQIAGQVMDMELGFAMVSVLDPQFGLQLPLIGSLLNLLGVLVFLALDGHLLLMRALRDSVLLLPPGGLGLDAGAAELLLRAFAATFVTALKLAAPVVAALFLVVVIFTVIKTRWQIAVTPPVEPTTGALGIKGLPQGARPVVGQGCDGDHPPACSPLCRSAEALG